MVETLGELEVRSALARSGEQLMVPEDVADPMVQDVHEVALEQFLDLTLAVDPMAQGVLEVALGRFLELVLDVDALALSLEEAVDAEAFLWGFASHLLACLHSLCPEASSSRARC